MGAADFAIVIGVDKYSQPGQELKHAVQGAVQMYNWLVKSAQVPKDNIILLLSPNQGSPSIEGLGAKEATAKNINWAILEELQQRSNYEGERFFFYFSGHGFTKRGVVSNEEAFIQSDYIQGRNPAPFSGTSLLTFFLGASFKYKFFIFDSCRDKNQDLLILQGFPPLPGTDEPKSDAPLDPIAFYATGLFMEANDFKGDFTKFLIDGLSGRGDCMDFNCDQQKNTYSVRVGPLSKFLKDQFALHPGWRQSPRADGAVDGYDLVLAELAPDKDVRKVKLALAITPPDAKITSVKITDAGGCETFPSFDNLLSIPAIYPRQYVVEVAAAGFEPARTKVRAFGDPTTVQIVLKRAGAVAASEPIPRGAVFEPSIVASGEPFGTERLKAVKSQSDAYHLDPGAFHSKQLARLEVRSPNLSARVALHDFRDRPLAAHREMIGPREVKNIYRELPPGIYKARVEAPGGRSFERQISVLPREEGEVKISPPPAPGTRLSNELSRVVEVKDHRHEQCVYCDAAGQSVEGQRVSTLLTIMSDAADRGSDEAHHEHGHWLEMIGQDDVDIPDQARSGLRILLASELGNRPESRDFVAKAELRFWPLDSPRVAAEHLLESSRISGLGGCSRAAEPGLYWLSIRLRDDVEVVLSITLLDGFLTNLVVSQDVGGMVQILQTLISRKKDGPPSPSFLGLLEEAEQLLLSGNSASALKLIDKLVNSNKLDPMSGCIGAHLLYTPRFFGKLEKLSERMAELYPALSDTHVIRAAFLATTAGFVGTPKDRSALAKDEFAAALKLGPPILKPWLDRLAAGVRLHQLGGSRSLLISKMVERSVPHPLWSAWRPERVEVGARIEPSDKS